MKEKAVFLYIVSLAGVGLSFVLHGEPGGSGFPRLGSAEFLAGVPESVLMIIAVLAALVMCSVALLMNLVNRHGAGWWVLCGGFAMVFWTTGLTPMFAVMAIAAIATARQKWKKTITAQGIIIFFICSFVYWPGLAVFLITVLMLGFSLYVLRLMEKLEKSEQAAEGIASRAEDMQALLGSQRRMVKSTEHVSRLEERNRLAARIHDEIGHGMSGSILLLEGADLVMDEEPERARETIRKVTENLRGSVEEIRKVLHEERTAGAEVSLARIENELAAFETDHPRIKTRIDTEGDMASISSAVWACICENMVEALTNMLKHSAATLFRVSLKNSGALLRVEFADNGGKQRRGPAEGPRGQDRAGGEPNEPSPWHGAEGPRGQDRAGGEPNEPSPWHGAGAGQDGIRPGIGLQNMEERAAMCHGRCFFRSEPDGFHIVMTFPRRDGL